MQRIHNKKAIIIGGTSGIGKAIVKKFSMEGANVIFCGKSHEKGQEITANIPNTEFLFCDITNKKDVQFFLKVLFQNWVV